MQNSAVAHYNYRAFFPRPLQRGFGASVPGSALISALAFTVIIALALAGMGTLTVSHYNLAQVQAASSKSLDLAEAGINWELNKLTTSGIGSADDGSRSYNASDEIAGGLQGTFRVACGAPDATTKQFDITCTALIPTATGQAKRIVRIRAQPYSIFYTLYSMNSTRYLQDGIVVDGISGSDGKQYISAGLTVAPVIKGVTFNGGNAAWGDGQNPDGYNVVHNTKALDMLGTSEIVQQKFPGGENYLATHNDNALAVVEDPNSANPPKGLNTDQHSLDTNGYQKVTLKGKPGGANYYLTNINMKEHSNLVFDNTDGPINIFYLNRNGDGSFLKGGHALKSLADAPDNAVKMFMSATGGLNIGPADPIAGVVNSTEVELGIYNYDNVVDEGYKIGFGLVNMSANVNFRGQVIANDIGIAANTHVIEQKGYFDTPTEYYGFSGQWTELNGAGAIGGANQ